jgi:hypothetical protein
MKSSTRTAVLRWKGILSVVARGCPSDDHVHPAAGLMQIKATLSPSHIHNVGLAKSPDYREIVEADMSETATYAEGTRAEKAGAEKAFPFSFDTSEFATLGQKRMEAFVNAQTELLDEIQEANRRWMDRFQSEANLASEYASKLSGARTIPDAMAVSRDWATRYFQMLAEDGRHFADDTRKLMETGARMFANGPALAA